MSFLQPLLLAALPLAALPILIHLINQRRFQTIPWAAMMFLLAARRMARGYSRLRQWLIMLFRMLAIAGLVLAVSRPLASGWLGLLGGGKPDTTIVLLDRSPSMQQRSAAGESKLEAGRQQLAQVLATLGGNRWVLIDSVSREPREMESPAALGTLPTSGPASAPADLPLMLQAAHDYIRDHRTGRTDVWICSDLRSNDWSADSGRWDTLRDAFLQFPQGVRFQLLAYPQAAGGNVAVRVTNVRLQSAGDGAELLVSVLLSRSGDSEQRLELPLQVEIAGARSVVQIELSGLQTEVRDHRIPIDASQPRGWGRVSIPADANAADNEYYFAFEQPPPRRTLIVAEDLQAQRPLELMAQIAPDDSLDCSAEVLAMEQLPTAAWDELALLLWQAPLPTGTAAELLEAFVDRGGQVVFFPPRDPSTAEIFGLRWQNWIDDGAMIESWRGDADLLSRTLSGAALPVGQLEIRRHCTLSGELTPLATLRGGDALVARAATDRGGVYFWTTTPATRDSSLATDGVVLYAFVQRALAAGAAVLGQTRQLDAGNASGESPDTWQRVAGAADVLPTEAASHTGVYSANDQTSRLLAVNRPQVEDDSKVLADARVAELFRGLEFTRVDDQAGSAGSLIQEIWRMFLMAMLTALVLEAVLCLPKLAPARAA
jgi:hypothetical protein